MATNVTDYGRDFILNVITGQSTMPSSLFVALTTAPPDLGFDGDLLADIEPTDTNYTRMEISNNGSFWELADGGFTVSKDSVTFPAANADYPAEITHFALCTDATSGEVILYAEFSQSKQILETQQPVITAGILVLSLVGPSYGELGG